MKIKYLIPILLLLIVGCRKVTLDFEYTPAMPVAGDTVKFTNLSTGGEDYQWTYGDNGMDSLNNPRHIYKVPGSYIVTLTASKTRQSCTHVVVVGENVPVIRHSMDSIVAFMPDTLTIQVWNPFSYPVTYQWHLPQGAEIEDGTLEDDQMVVHYTETGEQTVSVDVTVGTVEKHIADTYFVHDRQSQTLLMQTASGQQYYQRHYLPYTDCLHVLDYSRGETLLAAATPADNLTDDIERKQYYIRGNNLYVSHTNGQCEVLIATSVHTMALSTELSSLFYATDMGVYCLPLIRTANNQFATMPVQLNSLTDVSLMTIDNLLH